MNHNCQAPLSMGFPRQEYWSELPLPLPEDLPDSGIESPSPGLTGRFFTTEPPGKPNCVNESEVTQLWPTLCDPMGCGPPGSSVHGIFQARILKWVAIFFLQGIFPTQGRNLGLLHCMLTPYCLSHQGSNCVFGAYY